MRDIHEKGQMPSVTFSYNGKKPYVQKRKCIPLRYT